MGCGLPWHRVKHKLSFQCSRRRSHRRGRGSWVTPAHSAEQRFQKITRDHWQPLDHISYGEAAGPEYVSQQWCILVSNIAQNV